MSTPPSGKQLLHVHREHGLARVDPYHWLKDRNDPDTIAHLEAENAHTDEALGPASFRKALYDEMLARVQETDQSVPWEKNGWRYFTRTEEGRAYPIYARTRLSDGGNENPEEIVLDHNALAEGHAFYQIGGMSISRDQRRVAWLEDTSGGERYVLRVRDIASGQDLPVQATDLKWTLAWAADGETIFVTGADAASRPARALRVRLGDSAPTVVHEEPDEAFFVSLTLTHDERYVLIGSQSKTTSEWRILDAREPDAVPEIVEPRRAGIEYDVEHHEGRWLIRTNDHAKNFQVRARMPGGTIAVIVPPREDVLVEGVLPFRRFLVFQERIAGLPRLRIADLERGGDHVVDVPEPAYEIDFERNPEFDTAALRFVYASFVTPRSVFAYDMVTRERRLLKEDPVRGGYDRTLYTSERLTATAKDGAAIPISIVRRKDTTLPAPLLLYGYGAYGMSMPVWFSSSRLTLLDRGAVFAIAHVRGGSELGRLWYDHGKLEHKENTFDDFIAAAEHLVAVGMTTREQLAIEGASAGGLLVGSVLNKRPDLFRAAIAGVPFVDALNTMLDAQLPLTITEYEEWGNPTDRATFERIRAYAPYENVRPQRYPAILATAGLNDPRVGYWEAAKWVLRLRENATAGSGPILLHTNLDAGHAGASGRYQALEEQALRYAFLLQQWGLDIAAEVCMNYRKLGSTGLEVSTVCLGGMTFGEADEKSFMHGIGSDEQTSFDVLDNAMEVGINFVDVADVYGQDGLSERVLGKWFARTKARDRVVLATKFRFRMSDGPNGTGASRYRIVRTIEESLKRLQTDRIDLYQIHMQDADTPEDETLRALDDLVRAGKVLYVGASNYAAYRLTESQWTSRTEHLVRFVSLQMQYSLLTRELEREHVPLCAKYGIGIIPWAPLARGLLSGKYKRGQAAPAGSRYDVRKDRVASFDNDRTWRVVEAVDAIAKARGVSSSQVALAWLLHKPAVCSVIAGARTVEQLKDNAAAGSLKLDAEAMKTLDDASATELPYPYDMFQRIQGRW